ncbi:MAG: efflux RND transporter periplasmic adaptor subunit [Desulfatirhabdiaceae bacterium]|jgi:RND family efflux transporter MFP subunit|nr:efflux RND transporter periplasmic adaptor subunit [Desulfatirhabdiaceae bacterium]
MLKHRLIYGMAGMVFILFSGCSEKIEPGTVKSSQTQSIKAPVATAAISQEPIHYEATGTVTAEAASTLSSKIMGVVKKVYVKEGDRVKKDQVLVDIDPRQVKAQLLQAEAALSEAGKAESAALSAQRAARASADLARATYDRYANLMKTESASRQEFDEVSARFRQAEAALGQAEAMVEASRFRIQQTEAGVAGAGVNEKDSKLFAPFDGVVSAKLVDTGSLAAPGTPLLKLESTDDFRVDMIVPETYLQSITLSQKVSVSIPAAGSKALEGTVLAIFPAADAASRSFTVQVAIPFHPSIHSGMFSRVTLDRGNQEKLLIPASALIYQGQLTGIFLLDSDRIARFRILRTGRTYGTLVEALSGIRPGDRFVVVPPPDMVDGLRVEVPS